MPQEVPQNQALTENQQKRLPVLLFIPHGGNQVPEELKNQTTLSPFEIFEDGDPFTREIYNLQNKVHTVIDTDISRVFVDLNRTADTQDADRLDDKVVKRHTFLQKDIYKPGKAPGKKLVETLFTRYYNPIHARLKEAVKSPEIELCLNCHSMSTIAPPTAWDAGKKRPAICIGNNKGSTCSQSEIEQMAACFQTAFKLNDGEVQINDPFWGADVTEEYGLKPKPWMLIELSQDWYIRPPYFNKATLTLDPARITTLNTMFHHALQLYFRPVR